MYTTVGLSSNLLIGSSIPADAASNDYWPLLLLGGLVVSFIATWLASKLFAGDQGTAFNTAFYFIAHFVTGLVLMGITYALAAIFPKGEVIVLVVAAILSLVAAFWIPMRIYSIGVFRALGFVVMSAILYFVASFALFAGAFASLAGLSFANVQHSMQGASLELKPTPTPAELAIQVNRVHAELQRDRANLDVNDPAAVTRFNQRVAEYNDLRSKLALTQH